MGVPLVRRNLLHERGKLALHISGIGAALTLIALLVGFRSGMYASLTAYIDHIGADLVVSQFGSKGLFDADSVLPASLHTSISEAANAAKTAHILVGSTIFTGAGVKTPVLIIGYDPQTGFGGPWNIGTGRAVQHDDEILLDTWLAWRSGVGISDHVSLLGQAFIIVGLTRETSSWMSPYVFISQAAAEKVFQNLGDASFFLLRLPDGADAGAARQVIEAQISGVSVRTPAEMAAADQKYLAAVLDRPITVMILISVIIAVAVMGLITYTSVLTQLPEYSVLKALGASNSRLHELAERESLYRAALGFLLGIGLSYLTADLIMRVWPQFTIVIRPETIFAMGAAGLVMTFVAALAPVRQIAALDPATVFKA